MCTLLKAFYETAYRSNKYDFTIEEEQDPLTITVSRKAKFYYRVQVLQDIFGSTDKKKYAGSSMASIRLDFADLDQSSRFLHELLPHADLKIWAGQVIYYMEHAIRIPSELLESNPTTRVHSGRILVTHRFALVDFLKPSTDKEYFHVEMDKRPYKTLAEFWGPDHLPRGRHSIVPIHRLHSRCIYANAHTMMKVKR